MNYLMKHTIGGVQVEPIDSQTMGIRLDFMSDISEAELNVDTVKLTTEAYKLVNEAVAANGIFEGIPYQIEFGTVQLEYYINLTEGARFEDHHVECKIEKRWSLSAFRQRAMGLSFESLNKLNPITGIFDIPYVIVPDNQVEIFITLAISTFLTTNALIQQIKSLAYIIAEGINAATPNVGVGVTMDLGDAIALVLKIAAELAYTIALVIALIKLINQIIQLVMPKIRFLKGSKVKALIEQGCKKLGYTFSSTLLDAIPQLTLLPVPLIETNANIMNIILGNSTTYYNKGYPTVSDTTPMLWDLVEQIRNWCNGKVRVINKVVHLERRDHWFTLSSASILNTLNVQETRVNARTYNTQNTWKRYYLSYLYDQSDIHTLNMTVGRSAEYSTEPLNVINADIITISKLADVPVQFSLAKRKNELNKVEEEIKNVAQIADTLINTLGGNSNLTGTINNRIGVTEISQQHFTRTKLLYTIGGRQPANYLDKIGMTAVYNNYHAINQVRENFKSISESTIPLAPMQFEAILNNNVVYDQNAKQLEIRTFEWINGTATANIEYQQPSDLAFNTYTLKIA